MSEHPPEKILCFECVHFINPCAQSAASTCEAVGNPAGGGNSLEESIRGSCRVQLNWLDPDYDFDLYACKYFRRRETAD